MHVLENLFVHTNTRIQQDQQQQQQHHDDSSARSTSPLPPVAQAALNEFATPAVAAFLLQAFTETSGDGSTGGIGASGARLASAYRLVAGNALVHLLVYRPSLISKVFSMVGSTSSSTAESSSQRSSGGVGGLGIHLDAILRTIEVVCEVSGPAGAVGDGESGNNATASAEANSYAARHSRKLSSIDHPSNQHEDDNAPPKPITLNDRDEGLVRCSLNLLQLLLSRIAVCGPSREQRDAGNEAGALGCVDFDDMSRCAEPASLRKLRNSLLRRQHRLAAAVLGIFSPKVSNSRKDLPGATTAHMPHMVLNGHFVTRRHTDFGVGRCACLLGESRRVIAPSETLRAKAALVLRQTILQLDDGLATVLE